MYKINHFTWDTFWHKGWDLPWKTKSFQISLGKPDQCAFPNTGLLSLFATDKAGMERGGQRTVLSDQAELPCALALQSALQVHGDIGLALLLQAVLRAWKIKGAGGGEEVWNNEFDIEKTPHTGKKLIKHWENAEVCLRGSSYPRWKSLGFLFHKVLHTCLFYYQLCFCSATPNKARGRWLLNWLDLESQHGYMGSQISASNLPSPSLRASVS